MDTSPSPVHWSKLNSPRFDHEDKSDETCVQAFHVRTLIDRLARMVITVGGLATIVSILGIFLFLFREVTPLSRAPSAKLSQRLSVPGLASR